MKPRTKLQNEVIYLSNNFLRDITYKMKSWGAKECLKHRGFATKKRVICMDCGQTFSTELINRKLAICPHCGTKLKVEQTKKSTDKQQTYFAIAEIQGDFQVIRNFEMIGYYKSGRQANYFCWEILQHWIRSDGKHEVIARNHTLNWRVDSFNGDMEIRKDYGYYSGNKYDVYPSKIHPESIFKQEYVKYGISYRLSGLTPLEAIKTVPNNPKAETLLKAKQYGFLYHLKQSSNINYRWPTIKICLRNKYFPKDVKIYFDYLDLLDYFKKDLLNAHYVCPKDLIKAHDILVKRKRKKQEKEEAERKRKRALENEKAFRELKAKFFGICFGDESIKIKVLESVQEHMDEGDILHHCFFTNNYFLKPESLILSAKIGDKHIETIEVSLKEFKVIQSRGLMNNNSEFHDKIIEIVNKNMKLIKKASKLELTAAFQSFILLDPTIQPLAE